VYRKAINIGKFSCNCKAEYSPGGFRSANIMHVDEIVDYIDTVLSGVGNCILSTVGSFDVILIEIDKNFNSDGDIHINMTIYKFS
jgi:hypothetical protein